MATDKEEDRLPKGPEGNTSGTRSPQDLSGCGS